MDPRDKTPRSAPGRGPSAGKSPPSRRSEPVDTEQHRKRAPGGIDDAEGRAQAPTSEDFSERRDVETADEPAEEHDRQHHDRRRDIESDQAV